MKFSTFSKSSFQIENGKLDKKVYEEQKKKMLLDFIIPMKFAASKREVHWEFKTDGYWRHLAADYWYNPYFYTSVFKIFRIMLDAEVNALGRKLNKNSYQKYWRKRNKHNETTVQKGVDETKILIGKNVKGHINAEFSSDANELLIIEDDVVINKDVKFNFKKDNLIIVKKGFSIKTSAVVDSSLGVAIQERV